jgi:hypothetical protein
MSHAYERSRGAAGEVVEKQTSTLRADLKGREVWVGWVGWGLGVGGWGIFFSDEVIGILKGELCEE